MTGRNAFLLQAREDAAVWRHLNLQHFRVCHQLHYLQMVSEKLSRGMLASPTSAELPKKTHKAFVRFLQTLKSNGNLRRKLHYDNIASFNRMIDLLLDLAAKIERLAPQLAGMTSPNPEYPWRDAVSGAIIIPAEFKFPDFSPKSTQLIKLEKLIIEILRQAS